MSWVRSLFFLFCFALSSFSSAKDYDFTLLHFNDFHGHLSVHDTKQGKMGGIAKLASLVDQIRAENKKLGKKTFVLFAGDAFTGTPISSRWRGAVEIEALNRLKLDAMVVGNHEFDYKLDRLLSLQKRTRFPMLSANIHYKENQRPVFQPTYFLNEKEMPRLAVLGFTTQETPIKTHPKNVQTLEFGDPVVVAKDFLAGFDEKDFTIVLSHLEYPTDKKLLKKYKSIDLILGGHDHLLPEGTYCQKFSKRYICKTPAYSDFLGRVDVDVRGEKFAVTHTELIPLDEKVAEKREIKNWLSAYEEEIERVYSNIVGFAAGDLPHNRAEETPLGNLVADAFREYAKSDVALINSGAVRFPLSKGSVRMKDIKTILPFPNTLQVFELSGKELKEVIRYSFKQKGTGGFMQVSGLRIEGSAKNPKIYVKDRLLKPSDRFTVGVTDFIAVGGDGYHHFKDKKLIQAYPVIMEEVFIGYLKKQKVVKAPTLGRMQI